MVWTGSTPDTQDQMKKKQTQTPSPRTEKPSRKPSQSSPIKQDGRDWIDAELEDAFDEELELEIDDHRAPFNVKELVAKRKKSEIDRKTYFRELFRLQTELIRLQDWVQRTGYRLVVVFEGRDAAGKGGVIKRITQRLNPRVCRIAALEEAKGKLAEQAKTQPDVQRFVDFLEVSKRGIVR